jgi:hypothetical protein
MAYRGVISSGGGRFRCPQPLSMQVNPPSPRNSFSVRGLQGADRPPSHKSISNASQTPYSTHEGTFRVPGWRVCGRSGVEGGVSGTHPARGIIPSPFVDIQMSQGPYNAPEARNRHSNPMNRHTPSAITFALLLCLPTATAAQKKGAPAMELVAPATRSELSPPALPWVLACR